MFGLKRVDVVVDVCVDSFRWEGQVVPRKGLSGSSVVDSAVVQVCGLLE